MEILIILVIFILIIWFANKARAKENKEYRSNILDQIDQEFRFSVQESVANKRFAIFMILFRNFLLEYVLFNSLDFWTRRNYHSSLEGLLNDASCSPEQMRKMILLLLGEMMTYGINRLSIVPSPLLSSIAFAAENILLESDEVEGYRYKESIKRYKQVESGLAKSKLFIESALKILESFSKVLEKKPSETIERITREERARLEKRSVNSVVVASILGGLVIRSVEDVARWVLSLKEKDIYLICEKAIAMKSDEQSSFLQKTSGFGLSYFNKINEEVCEELKMSLHTDSDERSEER